jgi:hypothetical protein
MEANNKEEIIERNILALPHFKLNSFLDIELIKKHTPSLNYIITEDKKLEQYCTEKVFKHVMSKKNLFESKNCKNLIRSGLPLKYIRELILRLFDYEEDPKNKREYNISNFERIKESVLKNHSSKSMGDYVPNFSGFETLVESLPVNYLNEIGYCNLREILWIINSIKNDIEYSPIIINIVHLLLIFCNPEETYAIIKNLIDMNNKINETSKIRWQFRFNYEDNDKIIKSIMQSLNDLSSKTGKEILQHLENINFPVKRLFEDMVYGFFMDYLNFSGVMRLLPFFLLEGVKPLYRMSYAVLKTLRLDILKIKNPDDVIKIVREKSKEITDLNKLYNLAYSYKINKSNNKYDSQSATKTKINTKRNSYYLPKNIESSILSNQEFLKMWSQLPILLRPNDLKKIFDANIDGYSLRNIYNLKENHEMKQGIFFFIETTNNEVFGGFLSNFLTLTGGKFMRPTESFLISIRPNQKLYPLIVKTDNILRCDQEFIMFGNGNDGPAIYIKGDLVSGTSNPNNCYCQERLVENEDGFFEIKKFEVYLLE